MVLRRTKVAAFASKSSLRCGLSLAGAVLIASAFAVSASATPLGQAVGGVGALVPPVAGTSASSLPSVMPPQTPVPTPTPQAPVGIPTAPQAPVEISPAPQAPPVKLPTVKEPGTNSSHLVPAPSSGSGSVSSPGVDLPSADEITSGTKESAGTATSTSAAGVRQTAASARDGVGEGSRSHDATRPGTGAGSVESARAAPLPRLLAYVWPAIALGPARTLFAELQARWEAATSLQAVDLIRLLSGITGVTDSGGVAGLSDSASSNPSPADSTGTWATDGGAISLLVLIISCAALMALLVFAVRRELRSMYH